MKVTPVTRIFKFNNQVFPDPNPKLNIEQVRGILAATNPAITSAILQGPNYDTPGNETYEFVAAVGTKG